MLQLVPSLARPRKRARRYIVDPVAFFIALVGGPLLFTLATFWVLFVPVVALSLGALPYLIVGTPVLLFHLGRNPAKPAKLALLALFTIICLLGCLCLAAALTQESAMLGTPFFILISGTIFAPAWAATFGWVYGRLCRDFYAHPIPV